MSLSSMSADAGTPVTGTDYVHTYRRMLLDMHIPDWDGRFLADLDLEHLADLYAAANVTGVLFYTKSHVGLSYWPTPDGGVHRIAADRDVVGDMLALLRERGISPAAYHSVVFDNWAVEHHPDWAIVPPTGADGQRRRFSGGRYGLACPNNPGYREHERLQLQGLVSRYEIDALWIDMAFWPAICTCACCRDRFARETGRALPERIDWGSPVWTSFAAARTRWIGDFFGFIRRVVAEIRPRLPVTHNLAPGLLGWFTAQEVAQASLDDFAAGDLYGGRDQQLLVSKLMLSVSRTKPPEFMTSRTRTLGSHVTLKSEQEMLVQALATTAHHSAFLFIDAVDPQGTVNAGVYERMGRVFEETSRFEPFLGGTEVADVAVYYSDTSRFDPADSGKLIGEQENSGKTLPHLRAVAGAVSMLQHAHLPFGVLTRSQLGRLGDFRVLVLPDVLTLAAFEVDAIRDYVRDGGRLYASGRTGLRDTEGHRFDDFALADVFGCHVERFEDGQGFFLRPETEVARIALAPERYAGCGFGGNMDEGTPPPLDLPRIGRCEGEVIATLTLPFDYPEWGTVGDHHFASIHSSPPWEDLDNPTVVGHDFGAGRAVYSVAPLEAEDNVSNRALFAALILDLLDGRPTVTAAAPSHVWLTAFAQAERVVLSVLQYQLETPVLPLPLRVEYRPPCGRRIGRAVHALTGDAVRFSVGSDGLVEFDLGAVGLFTMVLVDFDGPGRSA